MMLRNSQEQQPRTPRNAQPPRGRGRTPTDSLFEMEFDPRHYVAPHSGGRHRHVLASARNEPELFVCIALSMTAAHAQVSNLATDWDPCATFLLLLRCTAARVPICPSGPSADQFGIQESVAYSGTKRPHERLEETWCRAPDWP